MDRFATVLTKQLNRYCSKYRNPGSEAVNALTVDWTHENNWIFPPPLLVPNVLRHMSACRAEGALIVPEWPSAAWWPLLINRSGSWKSFVKHSIRICPYKDNFVPASSASNIFTTDVPPLALKLCF